ncbi:iron hydrogenase [Anaeramoeba flamelloides]|uniref:Iron hydrogenase n=1 Tax=Anaeramoeba flamelloides TaxID=1746091 RepID=A0AAV7ZH57_9EUKA|nr:iron hydrogenase [Anaeramoeba flamelloides]
MRGHTKAVNTLAITNKFCFSGSNDRTVRAWSLENGYCTGVLDTQESPVLSLAVKKNVLYSSNTDGMLKSYNTTTHRSIQSFQGHTNKITVFTLDNKENLFSGSSDCSIKLWNLKDSSWKQTYNAHSDYITDLISAHKSSTLYSSSVDTTAIAWDIESGRKKLTFKGHKDWIFSMLLDKSKKTLYTSSQDRMVKMWDIRSGSCAHTLFGHEYGIVKMILNQNILYTASWDGRIGVYNLKKPRQLPTFLEGHSGKIRTLSKYGDYLYSGGNDCTIRVWSCKTLKCKAVLKGHKKPVTAIYIPNKNLTLSIGEERRIYRWPSHHVVDSNSKQELETLTKKEKQKISLKRDHAYDLGSKIIEKQIEININGQKFKVSSKLNILEACRKVGFEIEALCYHPSLGPVGTCKCCIVDVKSVSKQSFQRACACATELWEGMEIKTDSPKVREQLMSAVADLRKKQKNRNLLSKMVGIEKVNNSNHLMEEYIKNGEKRFKKSKNGKKQKKKVIVADENDTMLDNLIERVSNKFIDTTNLAIQVDHTKCIDCTRCIAACSNIQGMDIYSYDPPTTMSDFNSAESLMPAFNTKGKFLGDTLCISCGQCSLYCPSGAITEIDHTQKLDAVMKSKKKLVVVGMAPSARISMSEIFKLAPGSLTTGQCVHLLRLLGFNQVFDVQFAADLTIMEEGTELLHRMNDKENSVLPMFTSCCPGWVNLVEKKYPEIIPHLSSCKSPQQMFGSVIKNYYAKRLNLDPKDIYCVTVMPCTAKKKELDRPQFRNPKTGVKEVDLCLTVREMGRMVAKRGIEFSELEEREFDNPLGFSTGAAQLFASSGGVMEAALRSAYWLQKGVEFPSIEFKPVRSRKGIKESVIDFDGTPLRLAVVSGGKNIHKFLETWGTSSFNYDFIEIMACPDGCIGGGGQPRSNLDINPLRKQVVYQNENKLPSRSSYQNPLVKRLYKDWLKKPYDKVALKYLHTTYEPYKYSDQPQTDENSDKFHKLNEGLTWKNSYLILYGSQTGTAEKAALKIADKIRSLKYKVRIKEMNEYGQPIKLKHEKLVFLITSTFWDGAFPENALKFWHKLKELQPMSLTKLKFCVFGLGSSTYTQFNNAAKNLDQKFIELGAKKVLEIGLSNREDKNGYLTTLNPWLKDIQPLLKKNKKSRWRK